MNCNSYSDYLKNKAEKEAKEREFLKPVYNFNKIEVGRDMIGSTINQQSDLSDSPDTHKVITTPKIDESAIKIPWYKRTIFKYFIWPFTVTVTGGLIIFYWSEIVKFFNS